MKLHILDEEQSKQPHNSSIEDSQTPKRGDDRLNERRDHRDPRERRDRERDRRNDRRDRLDKDRDRDEGKERYRFVSA